MTPIEKAEKALNRRIEQLQGNLRLAKSEAAQRYVFQSIVVCIAIGEALTDYVRMIGQYAQGRHSELKATHATLTAQHADLLRAGNELLAQLKTNPGDRIIRKQIERAQQHMAAIQKTLRRGANALQREVAPSMGMIDKLAEAVKRLGEADQIEALQRAIRMIIGHVGELYLAQPGLPSKNIIDGASWEKSAASAIDEATDSYEAYARAGHQALLALDLMTMAVSPTPPRTVEEATHRASESAAVRLTQITARFNAA